MMLTNNFIKGAVIVSDLTSLVFGLWATILGYPLVSILIWGLAIALTIYWAKTGLK